MIINEFKKQFSNVTATAFQTVYPDIFKETGEEQVFSVDFIFQHIEKPKDATKGRFAFPVFRFSKLLKDSPPVIAEKIANAVQAAKAGSKLDITHSGGFINIEVDFTTEAENTLQSIISKEDRYGALDIGSGKKVIVEYSAPNIAKPFGIGHIRTTVLGNSLRLIFKKLHYTTIGVNYLGDWGTQFGKMIVAYKKWSDEKLRGKETVSDLLALYVKFHEEAENNAELENEARIEFNKLEQGDSENRALWESFREISLQEFNRVYELLGVEFDWVTGEAFLNDKMEPAIQRLEKAGLVSQSEGATIVDLHDDQLPPVLLKKADGATLYQTRDIAGYLYRQETYKFDLMLYVVATNQSVHFQQLFKTISMLEDSEKQSESRGTAGHAEHVEFGLIKFQDKMMATRKGHIIFLEDVIKRAADLAREKIVAKNPNLENIEETSLQIGLGAILYSQMSVRRQKEVNFSWEEVLSFEGETGPYLQYTHARLCSLLRNYEHTIVSEIDYLLLDNPEEKRIIELLTDFPQAILDAARLYDPNMIANHLIEIAGAFNKFYQRKDDDGKIDKIISDNKKLSEARIVLVKATQLVIKEGLRLLGIKAPEAM